MNKKDVDLRKLLIEVPLIFTDLAIRMYYFGKQLDSPRAKESALGLEIEDKLEGLDKMVLSLKSAIKEHNENTKDNYEGT